MRGGRGVGWEKGGRGKGRSRCRPAAAAPAPVVPRPRGGAQTSMLFRDCAAGSGVGRDRLRAPRIGIAPAVPGAGQGRRGGTARASRVVRMMVVRNRVGPSRGAAAPGLAALRTRNGCGMPRGCASVRCVPLDFVGGFGLRSALLAIGRPCGFRDSSVPISRARVPTGWPPPPSPRPIWSPFRQARGGGGEGGGSVLRLCAASVLGEGRTPQGRLGR